MDIKELRTRQVQLQRATAQRSAQLREAEVQLFRVQGALQEVSFLLEQAEALEPKGEAERPSDSEPQPPAD